MITKKEIQHIAKLARLSLKEKEIKNYQKELSKILDYIEKLKEIDISQIEPTSHPIKVTNVLREDLEKKEKIETVKKLIELAPEKKDNYLKVKSIF